MISNTNNSKSNQTNNRNKRRDLHTWLYYNQHFNIEQLNPLPRNAETPPPSYRHFKKDLLYQNEFIKPSKIKRKTVASMKKKHKFFDKIIDCLYHYCNTSTLHGLKFAGEDRFNKAEKIFWLMAFLTSVVFAIYFITVLFINYNASPVLVNFSPKMASVQSIPFPAITICNMNIAIRSRAQRIVEFGTRAEKQVLNNMCNVNVMEHDHSEKFSWETMEFVVRNITQLCDEMIIGCKWLGKAYHCPSIINSALTDDGYCCNFNNLPSNFIEKQKVSESSMTYPDETINWTPEEGYPSDAKTNTYPFRAFGPGVEQGLTLVLDAALNDYYCSTTHSFGFKARFHSPREHPKVAGRGFAIPPGVESRISIAVNIEHASDNIREIDYHKRKCFFSNEKFLKHFKLYSAKNCLRECEANYTEKTCGCVPFYLPREENIKICDKSDEHCTDKAKVAIETYGHEQAECECLPGCSQITYNPGVQSEGKLLNLNNITYHKYLGNLTQEYFAENIAILHIFYNNDYFEVQIKQAMYTFSDFLSNTGGLLGLFTGFGFLSVVEIFYFIFIRSTCVWYRNKLSKNKNKRKKVLFQ